MPTHHSRSPCLPPRTPRRAFRYGELLPFDEWTHHLVLLGGQMRTFVYVSCAVVIPCITRLARTSVASPLATDSPSPARRNCHPRFLHFEAGAIRETICCHDARVKWILGRYVRLSACLFPFKSPIFRSLSIVSRHRSRAIATEYFRNLDLFNATYRGTACCVLACYDRSKGVHLGRGVFHSESASFTSRSKPSN